MDAENPKREPLFKTKVGAGPGDIRCRLVCLRQWQAGLGELCCKQLDPGLFVKRNV